MNQRNKNCKNCKEVAKIIRFRNGTQIRLFEKLLSLGEGSGEGKRVAISPVTKHIRAAIEVARETRAKFTHQ